MADADRPLVSLVIASRTGGDALVDCVESFLRESDERFEIIVSATAAAPALATMMRRLPHLRVLQFQEPRSIPELRAAGIREARGAIVAMTTGRCRAEPGWREALRRAHGGSAAAVGGAIEYAGSDRAIDRAVFFCEYGRYGRPFARGRSVDLPGQNVSYSRAAIDAVAALVDAASWEPLWHWELDARGFELVRDPAIAVRMVRAFTLRGFLAERYHYSRAFAGQRVAGRSWAVRLAYAAATPLLPPLLMVRFLRQILAKRGRVLELLALMPYLLLFTIPWAAGELAGYVAGPGTSASRID